METFKPITHPLSRAALLAGACLLSPLLAGEFEGGLGTAGRELARRSSSVEEAQILLKKGDEAYTTARYADAVEAYSGARDLLPVAPISAALRAAATDRFAQASVEHARILARKGDLAAAKAAVAAVLVKSVAPENAGALAMQAQLDDPIRSNPALTAEHAKNVDAVRRLLYLAEGAYNLADFNEANANYEKVLRIDPTNTAARRGMEKLVSSQSNYFKSAYDHTRAKMLSEVDGAWETQVPPTEALPLNPSDAEATDSAAVTVRNKLDRIVIPSFILEQGTLSEAIDLLRARSLEFDTTEPDLDRKGLNFTVNLGAPDSPGAQKIAAIRFDMNLNNVPIAKILQDITEVTGTTYSSDYFSVKITNSGAEATELISQVYRVTPDFLSTLNAGESAVFDGTPEAGLLPKRLGAKEALMKKGVTFPEGTYASLTGSNLTVLNTALGQDLVSQIVSTIATTEPITINVRVTMIKVQQTRLEELGFDWILDNGGFGGDSWVPGASKYNLTGGTAGNGRSLEDINLPVGSTNRYPVTGGNRSGDSAVNGNSIDGLLSDTSGTQTSEPAPGILGLRRGLTGAEIQTLMRGLNQSKGVDMMAEPSVTTRSGQSTVISFVREFIYPTAYEPPQLPQSTAGSDNGTTIVDLSGPGGGLGGGSSTTPVTPATPTDFKSRDVGVNLEVLPVLSSDKQYVNLTLKSSFTEFDGFVNYGSPINSTGTDLLGNPITTVLTENSILMPIFSDERFTTNLDIADGATIPVGGLLREEVESVADQTPILGSLPIVGRLFQSRVRRPTSTAIVFLVNVELTNPAGQPYRSR
jgi:general secretion pathway protein D